MPTPIWRSRPAASGSASRLFASKRVQIEDRVAVEADFFRRADQKLDRVLVVEDHLRFESLLAFGLLAEVDQALGVEQRIGVALKAA